MGRATFRFALLVLLLGASPALAQNEKAYGESPAAGGAPAATASVFQTVKGHMVKVDQDEQAVYFTEEGTDRKLKVILDDKTKVRIDKKKGGPELAAELTEGMAVQVTVNTETGVAVSIKVRPSTAKG